MTYLNEDTLVQKTTTDYLRDKLGWDSVYAYNKETFGPAGLLGRNSDREVVLTRYLRKAIKKFNPELPETAYDEAVRQVVDYSQSQSMLSSNFDKYKLFKDGVLVSFQGEHGEIKKERLKIFDLADYKDTIPHFFHHNAIVMLANGEKAKIGSITSGYEHFHEWKRLTESDPGVVSMETLLKGVCEKNNFI